MKFEKFQKETHKTAIYPNKGSNYVYPALGLAGEAGEVAEKIKKLIRDNNGKYSKKEKDAIMIELGDVLWYVSQLCTEFKLDMDKVAEACIKKLESRKKRGTLRGSGDDR